MMAVENLRLSIRIHFIPLFNGHLYFIVKWL